MYAHGDTDTDADQPFSRKWPNYKIMLSLIFKVLVRALLWLYVYQCFTFSIYQKFRTFWYQTCNIRIFKILITGATNYLYTLIFPCRFLKNEICTLLEANAFLMPESETNFSNLVQRRNGEKVPFSPIYSSSTQRYCETSCRRFRPDVRNKCQRYSHDDIISI